MERRGVGKRLTDGQRVEILKLFDSGAAVSEADVARRYGVTRSAIWRLRRASQHIMERYQEGDVESRDDRRRGNNSSTGPVASSPSISSTMPTPQTVTEAMAFVAQSTVGSTVLLSENTVPLIYMSAKAIGSVQSPGIVNWERLNGNGDEDHFEVVSDGISVLQEGNYQINVDLEHSQPRQNYKCTFKVWNGKKLMTQCPFPLRTKKEISLSIVELRCRLPALAKLRVEFLAPGFAFHESRIVLRLVQ
ncbi:hypothetical protein JM18_000641 [Phytophthora kernoviae]|uniref:Uncharacterized protein n=2 Tax=Phytophthora kernoviae TaxID=325452 RepID=A0A921VG35_9STRA|nr:hypothetical protein G195_001511 [Phytophthora kernoviae 00238/432]KAG2533177.1 hypothetical protein JM18_000641 [Phytophthora kernoviae]